MITPQEPCIMRCTVEPLHLLRLIYTMRTIPEGAHIDFVAGPEPGVIALHGKLVATHPEQCQVSVLMDRY